jgi:Heparinase II/III-like protein
MHKTLGLSLRIGVIVTTSLLIAANDTAQTQPAEQTRVDPQRVDQIASMLAEGRFAFGPAAGDREGWEKLAREPAFAQVVQKAQELLDKPIPELTDDLFLDYSRTGNRVHYESVYFERTGRLMPLVVAEGIEHRRRFVAAIEKLARAFCAQKTWMLSAHDGSLKNFRGESHDIDLFSSGLACNLATASWLLDDELSEDSKTLIDQNVHQRVLDPFAAMMRGQRPLNGWLNIQNNWNAVCLCNVTGAALAQLSDRHDRALYLAGAEKYSNSYLAGFDDDGYCVEGMGYWNYGFGNYIRLSELAWRVSGGKLDWFDRPKVAAIAAYPNRFELTAGVYPALGDTGITSAPIPALAGFVGRRFGLAMAGDDAQHGFFSSATGGGLSEAMMFSCPNSSSERTVASTRAAPALRDWFDDAKVLICRPADGAEDRLSVAIKAGHNGLSHGHDDLGSFVAAIGKSVLLADPGSEVYTARTFSKDRYQSKVLNSFGHNVPIVDDVLQGHTAAAKAEVIRREASDDVDTLTLDLTSAYSSPDLKELRRTFVYDRSERGTLGIMDEAEFSPGKSHQFGVTFITFGHFKQMGPKQLLLWDNKNAVQVDLDGGAEMKITAEAIDEETHTPTKPLRIAAIVKASGKATIHTAIRPTAVP